MKILVISDTHTQHDKIPLKYLLNESNEFSMIIHSGDVSYRGSKSEIRNFLDWYSKLPYKYKIFIAGNHDFFFEEAPEYEINSLLNEYPNIIYLNDSGIDVEGVKIWGSPVTPYFNNWAFNRVEENITPHWNLIPLDVEVLITHGPVNGCLDMTLGGEMVGCPFLLKKIEKMGKLKFHICGHIHEGYGIYKSKDGKTFINASVLDVRYILKNKPIEIEIKN
jgi:predicted phosphodiesterase